MKESNVRLAFSFFFALVALSFMLVICRAGGRSQRKPTLTGEFRAHKNFHSKFLQTDRDVLVYLPPGYGADDGKRYPVLYLHDGQNLFDGATSFIPGKEWQVDETAQSLIKAGAIEPVIIVGVYNAGIHRVDEYTPTRDLTRKMGGKADLYARMLVEELKPFIDSSYRTLPDPSNTGLGGSSLGGLVTLYFGLKHTEVFGKLAVVSPSVWWDNQMIVREVRALGTKPRLRIWLDMGAKEEGGVKDVRLLRDALIEKGWVAGADLKYLEAEGAEHNEQAWAARVEPILRFLFPKK
jgi:predicted alpha/beta superfamily hydrolase